MKMMEIMVVADFLQRGRSRRVLEILPSPSPCGSPDGPTTNLSLPYLKLEPSIAYIISHSKVRASLIGE